MRITNGPRVPTAKVAFRKVVRNEVIMKIQGNQNATRGNHVEHG
jgi:hypothetical protein